MHKKLRALTYAMLGVMTLGTIAIVDAPEADAGPPRRIRKAKKRRAIRRARKRAIRRAVKRKLRRKRAIRRARRARRR